MKWIHQEGMWILDSFPPLSFTLFRFTIRCPIRFCLGRELEVTKMLYFIGTSRFRQSEASREYAGGNTEELAAMHSCHETKCAACLEVRPRMERAHGGGGQYVRV